MTNNDEATLREVVVIILMIMIGACLVIGTISFSIYKYHQLEVQNFQITIKDLSEEQKCLHICGFQWDGYLENYKFCAEKCDRISERLNEVSK